MIYFLVCLALHTIIHEAGHYSMSRILRNKPTLLKIGTVGPVVFKKGIVEIAAIPISGRLNHADKEWATLPSYKQKLVIAAGPFTNLIAGLATLYWSPMFGLVGLMAGFTNLIPYQPKVGLPSDGGQIFTSINMVSKMLITIILSVAVSICCYLLTLSITQTLI